jgi:hypothetical protein
MRVASVFLLVGIVVGVCGVVFLLSMMGNTKFS